MAALMEIMEALNKMPQENLAKGYAEQLRIIETSLAQVKDEESRAAIEDLKRDLTELMELTKATVEETEEDNLAAEERRFKEELALLEVPSATANDLNNKVEVEPGKIYQAPHEHTWGSIAYHNAIVSNVEEVEDEESGKSEVYVRVFFTNPTHREMLPCNYYLDGNCRFDADNCHFSHGELVNANLLREYKCPEFERLKKNCLVLAKLDDKLWHRGRVVSADFVNKNCCVRLDADYKGARERALEFEDLLPIFNDEDGNETSSSDSEEEENLANKTNDCQTSEEINENIMEIHIKQPLGEWEKHTRGIGSKLMMKMGYIPGNGLGSRGKGITVPISAQVLPQGCSLDTCMNLREKANGDKDLFSVERKLKREQKKQEQINARAYERESKRTDVFSFLNQAVLKTQEIVAKPQQSQNKKSMQQQTTKALNVAQMQISDDIRKKSREINQMQETFRRQTNGTESYKRLQAQINVKNQELLILKREERNLSKEQANRRTTEKFVVF